MPFGEELLNLDSVGTGSSTGARFREAIRRLLADTTRPRGGILYVPPGRYVIENDVPMEWSANLWESYLRADDNQRRILFSWKGLREENPFAATLRFPAELTLWLAPGAVLAPAPGAIVHIESALVCEPIRIFDLDPISSLDPGPNPNPRRRGLVVFGSRVPRLIPQWWGVGVGKDALAIQDALDAGVHNRETLWEGANTPERLGATYAFRRVSFPCIPVELRGDYHLRYPVEVRGGATQNALLEILGTTAIQRSAPSTVVRETIYVGIALLSQ